MLNISKLINELSRHRNYINKNNTFTHKNIQMMNIIGTRIKKIREEKGIKQEYIAHEMEISQGNYSRLEKDDSRLNVPKLQKIVKILNISFSSLFDEGNSFYSENNEEQKRFVINKEYIQSLKEEIIFLRKMLENKK